MYLVITYDSDLSTSLNLLINVPFSKKKNYAQRRIVLLSPTKQHSFCKQHVQHGIQLHCATHRYENCPSLLANCKQPMHNIRSYSLLETTHQSKHTKLTLCVSNTITHYHLQSHIQLKCTSFGYRLIHHNR